MIIMCSVCFSGADPMARAGLNAGIIVLLGVTAAVLACFACFFIRLAQRSRAAAHLVGERESLPEQVGFAAGAQQVQNSRFERMTDYSGPEAGWNK